MGESLIENDREYGEKQREGIGGGWMDGMSQEGNEKCCREPRHEWRQVTRGDDFCYCD